MDEALKRLVVHEPDFPLVEALWPHILKIDPERRLLVRMKQRSQLGRYMHQSVFKWDEMEVTELEAYYEELVKMLEAESSTTRVMEDRIG